MKKIIIISSLIFSTLFSDNSLGTPLSTPVLKPQHEIKSYSKNVDNPSNAKPKYSKRKFQKDDHRYDKRYSNFDYERDGYYNDEGYYYGYYDHTGYFYNNIFFTYNSRYTYYDREHEIGYFRPEYQQHRVYEYHQINDWNRVHCYREPDTIIYGYYYDRPSYRSSYQSHYSDTPHYYYPDNARMHTNRDNFRRENYYRNDNHRYSNHQDNNYRTHNYYNSYQRSDARMRTRNSSNSHRIKIYQNHRHGDKSRQHSSSHMQLSR